MMCTPLDEASGAAICVEASLPECATEVGLRICATPEPVRKFGLADEKRLAQPAGEARIIEGQS
jgi:hypothetical protein